MGLTNMEEIHKKIYQNGEQFYMEILGMQDLKQFLCLFIQNNLGKLGKVRKNMILKGERFDPWEEPEKFFEFFNKIQQKLFEDEKNQIQE